MLDPGDDTYADWSQRARDELAPLLAIDPYANGERVALGFDATYGQPAHHPAGFFWSADERQRVQRVYKKLGGPNGFVARWLEDLSSRGHRIYLDPMPLAKAKEMHGYGMMLHPRFLRQAGRRHRHRSWGRWAELADVRGERVLLVNQGNIQQGIDAARERGMTALVPAQKLVGK